MYKVGDKVRIASKEYMIHHSRTCIPDMLAYRNQIATITYSWINEVYREPRYKIDLDKERWNWDEPCFKPVYQIKLI